MQMYELVQIKETGETGQIVEISRNREDGSVSQYLVEKDEIYMDGENDIGWFYPEQLEPRVFALD